MSANNDTSAGGGGLADDVIEEARDGVARIASLLMRDKPEGIIMWIALAVVVGAIVLVPLVITGMLCCRRRGRCSCCFREGEGPSNPLQLRRPRACTSLRRCFCCWCCCCPDQGDGASGSSDESEDVEEGFEFVERTGRPRRRDTSASLL